jgi:hypothetical protein
MASHQQQAGSMISLSDGAAGGSSSLTAKQSLLQSSNGAHSSVCMGGSGVQR